MKVEVFYFPGCPHHLPAVKRVRAVLDEEGETADVLEIEVLDSQAAQSVRFLGSPSVRINGTDIEGPLIAAGPVGLGCRTYMNGSRREGLPPVELIRDAIRKAKDACQ